MHRLTHLVKASDTAYMQVLEILNKGFALVPSYFNAGQVPVTQKEARELEERLVHKPYQVLDAGSHNFSSGFDSGNRENDAFCFVLNESYVKEHAGILRVYASAQSKDFRRLVQSYGISQYSRKQDPAFESMYPMPDQMISLEKIPVNAVEVLIMQLATFKKGMKDHRDNIYELATTKGITVLGYEPIDLHPERSFRRRPSAPL